MIFQWIKHKYWYRTLSSRSLFGGLGGAITLFISEFFKTLIEAPFNHFRRAIQTNGCRCLTPEFCRPGQSRVKGDQISEEPSKGTLASLWWSWFIFRVRICCLNMCRAENKSDIKTIGCLSRSLGPVLLGTTKGWVLNSFYVIVLDNIYLTSSS